MMWASVPWKYLRFILAAETIIGLYKTELINRRGPWRRLEAVEYATLEWVDWFNNRRLLAPIGNIPPAEAEATEGQVRREHGLGLQNLAGLLRDVDV